MQGCIGNCQPHMVLHELHGLRGINFRVLVCVVGLPSLHQQSHGCGFTGGG